MAQDSQSTDYVYDYIYLDSLRLTSYLSQIDANGVLTSIKQSRGIQEDAKELTSMGITMSNRYTQENNATTQKEVERNFDANIATLYAVIDKLDELGFIGREISNAGLGQMVLVSGALALREIRTILKLWEPAFNMSKMLGSGDKLPTPKQSKVITDLLAALPHTLLMILQSDQYSMWATLEEANLKINADDITLKHGASIAGKWHILGILDALPDNATDNSYVSFNNDILDNLKEFLTAIKQLIGRPSNSYGITPIAIFRTVQKH